MSGQRDRPYRFQFGEYEIIVISDGFIGLPLSLLAANAPEEDVLALMQAHDLGTEFATVPAGIVLIRTSDRLALVDNGTGTSDFARSLFGDYIGGLAPTIGLDELASGIQALATVGHSPGHHATIIESGGQQLLLPFDVLGHPGLHLRHLEWYMGPDQMPDLAVETRKQFFARVADEKIQVLAHHFPFPGLGHISRDGDAYRYIPTS